MATIDPSTSGVFAEEISYKYLFLFPLGHSTWYAETNTSAYILESRCEVPSNSHSALSVLLRG